LRGQLVEQELAVPDDVSAREAKVGHRLVDRLGAAEQFHDHVGRSVVADRHHPEREVAQRQLGVVLHDRKSGRPVGAAAGRDGDAVGPRVPAGAHLPGQLDDDGNLEHRSEDDGRVGVHADLVARRKVDGVQEALRAGGSEHALDVLVHDVESRIPPAARARPPVPWRIGLGTTLGDVIDTVGVLDLLVAPRGLEVAIAEAVIYDAEENWIAGPGDVILAVGVDPTRPNALVLAEKAGGAGAAALVVKRREDVAVDDLVRVAADGGVAVLAAAPELSWGQLHAMVRTASAIGAGEDPTGVPIGDLFALANAIAGMLGGPVTIEDPRSNVLAYSNLADHEVDDGRRATILGHKVPEEWIKRQQEDGVFRRLFRNPGVVRADYEEFGLRPRLATAIRAGDEILGTIWVQEGTRPLDDESEVALQEAARIASLHLLRHRSSADLERGRRTELLRAALEGRAAPDALAAVLQLTPGASLTVVALEVMGEPDAEPAAVSVIADRSASMVTLYCESYRRHAAVVAIGGVVYMLMPHADAEDSARLPAFVAGICERIRDATHCDVRAGVGATVTPISRLRESRDEADRVRRALAVTPWAGPVATAAAVRAPLVLQYLKDLAAAEPTLRAGKLDVLVDHDAKRGTEYVATLRAFFEALGDMPAAAAAQGVHPNTFRYRMRRLAETAALDLDDPVERLVLQLQLHFL
jgi:PucR-like helix-turn-helix protein/diguanylate cyclase with GGDEF domain